MGVRGTCEGGAGETERTLVGVEAPAGGRGEGGVAVGVFLGVRARAPRGRGMLEQGHKSLSGECGVGRCDVGARAGWDGVRDGAGTPVRRDLNRDVRV